MKILITGGAGFIGSHLSQELLALNHSVVVLDDLSTGSFNNISSLNTYSAFEFINGSILDDTLVQSLVERVDGVMHLGAALGVQRILEKPFDSLITNTHGTENVVKAAAKFKKRFFLASTSEIYGKNTLQPLTEDADRVIGSPKMLRWAYSDAKALDESLLQMFFLSHNLEYVIARFFNTVGPRQSGEYGMVLPRFVDSAIKNLPLQIFGNGNQSRSFCHVSDVVQGVLKIFFDDKALGHAFNIGGEEEVTMTELAERVIAVTNSSSTIEYVPYSEAYPAGFEETMRRVPDTTKLRKTTGWKPAYSLEGIIQDIEKYLRASR